MIKLQIKTLPLSQKRKEFSQTMELIKTDLRKHSISLSVVEEDEIFYMKINFETENKFNEILHCKEFHVLSGAIKMLAESSEIVFSQNDNMKKWTDLDKARCYCLKNKKQTNKS